MTCSEGVKAKSAHPLKNTAQFKTCSISVLTELKIFFNNYRYSFFRAGSIAIA